MGWYSGDVLNAGGPLFDASHKEGAVKAHVTVEQILDMVLAIITISGDPDYVDQSCKRR